jgi:universal stress protein A
MAWKRILVPYDFSTCAAQALRLAADLAELHGARIVVLHASELPENLDANALVHPPDAVEPTRADAFAMRGARAALEELAEPLRARGLDVRAMALVGEVSTAILEAVADTAADVVVMGTHGRTGLSHLLLGSVAEKVVRHATVPVVTTRLPGPEVAHTAEERALEDELAG